MTFWTWNPFRKYDIVPKDTDSIKVSATNIDSSKLMLEGTETAQLRSLKARTEIKMLYENIAEQALNNMKGGKNASII